MKFKSLLSILVILLLSNMFSQAISPTTNILRQQITGDNAKKIILSADKLIVGSDGSISNIEISKTVEISTERFISNNLSKLGLSDASQLKKMRENSDKLGMIHKRYKQYFEDYEILVGEYIFHEQEGNLMRANGVLIPDLQVKTDIVLSETEALKIALNNVNADEYMWQTNESDAKQYYPSSKLVISSKEYSLRKEDMRLVYQFDIYSKKPIARYNVEVDAITGEIINAFNKIHTADVSGSGVSMYNGTVSMTVDSVSASSYRLREISRGDGIETYDLQNGSSYTSAIDFTDSDTFFDTDDVAVNAHWGTEKTYDYYWDMHGRDSYDDNGAVLKSYVHYGTNYFNAFWNGSVMTYGDGDGVTATALVSLDIIGHEITHAVTERTAGLIYSYESGAINESFSDVFGQSIEFHYNDSTASWNLADEIFIDGVSMIRSMSDPNSQGDPDTYLGANWWTSSSDNGGVHTNSGVQNYWYYLLVDGGEGTNDHGYIYRVLGIGLENAEQIAYRNLSVYLTPSSQYIDARAGSEQAAIDLFGAGSAEYDAVFEAWNAVGVPCATPQLNVVETSLDFGSFVVGYTDSLTVKIQNIGTGILNVDSVYTTSSQFAVKNTNISITTNSTHELAVSFSPDAIGSFTDSLFVVYGSDTQTVALHGLGQDEPEIDVNPTSFSFVLNEGDSTNFDFTITNSGIGDLYFKIIPSSIAEATIKFNQRAQANFQARSVECVDGRVSTLESSFFAQTYVSDNKGAFESGEILIVGSDSDSTVIVDVKDYLINSGEFSSVTIFNAYSATPTVEEMEVFDAVLVYGWWGFYDQDALGDNLANFVDNGGNLLVALAANDAGGAWGIGGRFDTDSYWLIESGTSSGGSEVNLGSVHNSLHPIMSGISDISANASLTHYNVDASAEVLADLSNGYPLIAVNDSNSKRVDLSIPLLTLASSDWGIDTASDADELIVNAVKWMVGGSDWVSIDVQEDTLSTSQSVTVNGKVRAGDLLGGDYEGALTVLSNDLDESEIQIDIALTVIGIPNLEFESSTINLDTLFTGVDNNSILTFYNTGSDLLEISSVYFSFDEFSIDTTTFTVPPKSSVERTITFNSPLTGTFISTMIAYSNDPDEPAKTVVFTAEAVDPPIIGVDPTFFDVTLNSGDSTTQTLTISNTGGSDLDWNLSVDDVTKSYTLTRSGPGTFTLDGKTVTVNPEKATPLKGDFEDLTGVNILYDLSISSYVVLRSDLELRGATFTQITHPLTDLSPYNIFITDDSHSDSWTGGEYILLQDWVAGGGALFIDGDNSDELSHYNALIPVSAGITMNANGDFVAPTPIIYQHEITDSVASVYSTAAGSWLTLSAPAERILEYDGGTIVDGEALMAASKSGLGKVVVIGDELFNEYNISDNDNQLLANQTFDWLVGSSTIVTDVESGTIFAGSSEDVLISVHTIGMNAGVYNYNINITSNDPVDPEVDVPFDLTVIGVPNISVQDSVDFDEVFTGVTDSQIVTIDNIGTDVLNISSVDFGLTEYTIDMTAFTVPPKSSVERRITFSSLLTGIFNSTMIFNSNDPDEPARAVELTAEAVDPPIIGVSPTFFDVTLNSGDSTTQTLTISNTGGSDLEWDLETSYITAKSGTSELYERYKDNVIYEYHADKYRSGNRKIAPIPLDELNSLKGNTKILSWIKFTDASTYSNTINAISQYYTECTFDTTTTINQVKLGTLLNNADVFIIPPQFGGYSTFFNSLGSSWSSVLNEFVNYGGIIIQCGATADYYFGSDALLNSAGLFSFQSIDYITSGTMNVDNTHFITEKIPSAINAQPYTFFSNITDSEAVELVTYSGNNTLAIKEIGRGGIVVLGNDFYNYDNDVAMIISNAVQWKSSTNLISNPDSGTIPAGSSEDVLISVHTIGLNAGVYNYNIKISSNDPVNPEVDVPFDLTVVGVPNISVQDSVNFDEVFTGVTDSQIVTIDNIGTDVLNISSVDFDLTEYSIDATVFSVPPKSSVERTITFNSPVAGTFTSIMTAHSNDPDDPAKTVVITADAVDPPIIGVSPAFFDVTLNSGDSTTQTLTISNTGGSDLDWYIDIFEVGAKAKTVSLYDQYKHLVNYEVSSDKYNSGKAKVAPIPLSKIEELKGDIQILAWTTYADMAREYPNTINAISQYFTDFTISTSTSTDPTVLNTELSDKDVLLIPEQEGGSESIFTALGSSWTTTLTNFVNNGGTIILCGSYISSPSHEILNTSGLMTMSYYDYSSSSTMAVDTTHFITSGVPASITAQNLTVLYDITDPSTIDLVTISGYTTIAAKEMGRGHIVVLGYDFYDYDDNAAKLISNAVQWSGGSGVDPDIESGTIFAGSSEDVLISVHTIDMNAGVYNYNINISSNDPVDPEVDVPLDLTVIGAPNISMQDSVDFDKVFTGVTDSQIVTIDNIGTDVLNISSVDFDLTEFSIDATVFSVPPKSSVERTITFNSPVTGTFTSIMTAHSNDPDEPAKTTVLTAEAVNPPIISVSPDSFYVSLKSGDSTTQTLTISNTGGSDLDWNLSVDDITKSYTLTRPGPGTFTLDGKTVTVNPEKATTLKGDFEDLTGVNILYDLSISSYAVLRSDLELRGATFTQLTHPLTDLSSYDIFITDDSNGSSWTGGEYTLLQDWVASGGSLFIDGDNSDELSHYNALIPATAGITMNPNGDFVDPTPIIFPHEITDSVVSIYSTAAGSWLTLSSPAERILEYAGGTVVDGEVMMAASKSGLGRVVVIGDELFNEFNISGNDNQLLANQTFDWLVGSSEIDLEIESGTIFAGSSEDVLISVHTRDLDTGEYNYNINVISNDPVNPSVDVHLKLNITSSIFDNWSDLLPKQYELKQNYPNPFNPLTTIVYGLPERAEVTIEIYNMMGQKVETLINGNIKQAGYHKVVWNARQASSGIYFYSIKAKGNKKFHTIKKMVLNK